ncbi:MAG: hypothetical protein Q8K85_03050, partial [Hyphomicrobium sp.]|nr:hypothetical protein [Hyphomicrobium sp.]
MARRLVALSLVGAAVGLAALAGIFLGDRPVTGAADPAPARAAGYCDAAATRTSRVVRDACTANPGLAAPNLSQAEATSILRRWAASWIDVASDGKLIIEDDYWQKSVDTLYERFLNHERGVYCGGTAWTLMKLFEAFGLESWIYNFGDSDTELSHVVTLVRADGRVIVQDAYFNYTLKQKDGSAADILEILAAMRERRAADSLVIATEPVTKLALYGLDEVPSDPRELTDWMGGDVASVSECELVRAGVVKCKAENVEARTVRNWERWPDLQRFLAELGYPEDSAYLMLLPLGLSSSSDGW